MKVIGLWKLQKVYGKRILKKKSYICITTKIVMDLFKFI